METWSEECFQNISIHALREEGDEIVEALDELLEEFLSTPSARRATAALRDGDAHK